MAERIVSPGVFTREVDASFLPAAVSDIGAALIGVCSKGPAFIPTVVNSFSDFKLKFGGLSPDFYLPYTAKSYLKNAGTCTVVRVLGTGGSTQNSFQIGNSVTTTGVDGQQSTASIGFSHAATASNADGDIAPFLGVGIEMTGSDGLVYVFEPVTGSATDYQGSVENWLTENSITQGSGRTYYYAAGTVINGALGTVSNLAGVINSGSSVHGLTAGYYETDAPANWTVLSVSSSAATSDLNSAVYGEAGDINMIHTQSAAVPAGITAAGDAYGYAFTYFTGSVPGEGHDVASNPGLADMLVEGAGLNDHRFLGGTGVVLTADNNQFLLNLNPTASQADGQANTLLYSEVVGGATLNDFNIKWPGGNVSPTMSLVSTDSNYIVDILGNGPTSSPQHPAYVKSIFVNSADHSSTSNSITGSMTAQSYPSYQPAYTPVVQSQTGSNASDVTDLFKFYTISDGDNSNREVKVAISNVKKAGSVAGSDYGSFDVVVRAFDDTDKRPQALETYAGCNLDVDSPNYVGRRIGDQIRSFADGKVSITGDFENKSKYIRVGDLASSITDGTISPNLVPFGFGSYAYPFKVSVDAGVSHISNAFRVDIPLRNNQTGSDGTYNSKLYHGIAFDSGSTATNGYGKDVLPYLSAVPNSGANIVSSSRFNLMDIGLNLESSLNTKKFIMGFQGGHDGFDFNFFGGPNSNGLYHGLGKADPAGTAGDKTAFKDAIDTVSNADEVDINMVVIPGINSKNHNEIYVKARDAVEDRGDAFYIFDAGDWQSTNADVISNVDTVDSNYSSTYWPWVKIFDDENNKHVWVPPSVVVPGVVAFTDRISHPWFAPAGLNRGGLTDVIMAKDRLTHSERDELYEGRVNPIATFPGEGVVVWGQKTLQAKPSALDRVNVRRLLIKVKKFIAASSRYLVFEQNTEATRQRFLNIVNPFLESVQSNSGLTSFRVVVDETVNTPDVIDRNELRGQIFVQPARTAEFIVLDFVVLPTGASFPE